MITTTGNSYIMPNSGLLTTGIYTMNSITISGSLAYINSSGKTLYTMSDLKYNYGGHDKPVYISHTGRAFIFVYSKNSREYKLYLK